MVETVVTTVEMIQGVLFEEMLTVGRARLAELTRQEEQERKEKEARFKALLDAVMDAVRETFPVGLRRLVQLDRYTQWKMASMGDEYAQKLLADVWYGEERLPVVLVDMGQVNEDGDPRIWMHLQVTRGADGCFEVTGYQLPVWSPATQDHLNFPQFEHGEPVDWPVTVAKAWDTYSAWLNRRVIFLSDSGAS